MVSRQMSRDHLRKRIDVEAVARITLAQCGCDGKRELLQQGIDRGESRHDLNLIRIARVHFASHGCEHRFAQIYLQDLRIAGMLPLRCGLPWGEAQSAWPDQRSLDGIS